MDENAPPRQPHHHQLTVARAFPCSSSGAKRHSAETFESFTERYVQFFQTVESLFEVQRSLK